LLLNHTSESFQTYSCPESEGDLPAVPRQTLQVQTTGRVEDVEHIDSGMYDLFGAGHGKSTFEFATGDGHQQLRRELRDEGESDETKDDHSATKLQRGNGTSDYQDKSYYLTTANGGDHAKQRSDLDAAVGYPFSVEDSESTYHGE
jgi:hypothetical protein